MEIFIETPFKHDFASWKQIIQNDGTVIPFLKTN
jgi:hypothetical protein